MLGGGLLFDGPGQLTIRPPAWISSFWMPMFCSRLRIAPMRTFADCGNDSQVLRLPLH